jgi:uncharacterized protein DUF2865
MRQKHPGDRNLIVSINRLLRRGFASSVRSVSRPGLIALALAVTATGAFTATGAKAQVSEQQIRCMQLQQDLASARGGGGPGGEQLRRLQQEIAEQDRKYQSAQASMDRGGCYERLFIFGRALKRNPRCLKLNANVEDARRQLARLQERRKSLKRGGGNKRRQNELQQALQRNGCSGAPRRSGGGLFDFFGGGRQEYQTPVYRSINPNGRYHSVCVRLCDGFYFPVSYSTYGSRLEQDKVQCEQSCAAPAELYVYRNPGGEIQQAISLQGSAYMDLPVALKFRKEYVKGCSCKQTEYNPTEIMAANKKKAEVIPAAAETQAAAPAVPVGDMPQLNLDVGAGDPQ